MRGELPFEEELMNARGLLLHRLKRADPFLMGTKAIEGRVARGRRGCGGRGASDATRGDTETLGALGFSGTVPFRETGRGGASGRDGVGDDSSPR